MRVEETAITVGGESCSGADEGLKARPGAASDAGKASAGQWNSSGLEDLASSALLVVPESDKGLQSAGSGSIQLGGCGKEYDLEFTEKFDRYQADYVRWIKAKYFSKKSFDGGNIYDMETTIDNAVIKSSRWPCTRSFLDPVLTIEDQSSRVILPPLAAETSTLPSRKHHFKKISYHS